MFLDGVDEPGAARAFECRLRAAIEKPVTVRGRELPCRVSIGVSLVVPGDLEHVDAIHRADRAMYADKRRRKQEADRPEGRARIERPERCGDLSHVSSG